MSDARTTTGPGRPAGGRRPAGGLVSPRQAAARLEAAPRLPYGVQDRFSGYGVLGVTFASSHILALRRFPASSLGPAFTSVWHRDPGGRWTFYVDTEPELTAAPYFVPMDDIVREDVIGLTWHGPTMFTVQVPTPGIAWAVHLAPTPGGRTLATVRRRLPAGIRRRPGVQRLLTAAAGRLFRLDGLTLQGRTPTGHRFQLDAHDYWMVDRSSARCHGRHLGPPVSLARPAALGDFSIPVWGVFATGDAFFEPVV